MAPQIPKVSVVVLAYNHALYLDQALASVLAQKAGFLVEVIVGEDCSPDQTRRIVREYERRYPDIIRPIYHPQNVGMGGNFKACLAACRGQYIALLEGDDYWTDPLKLEKQVAWLDEHPDFSLCFHLVEDLHEDGFRPQGEAPARRKEVYTFDDFLTPIYTIVSTGATLLRNHVLPGGWPEWLFTVKPIDFAWALLYAEHGKAKLLPEVMGVYRIHGGGLWSGSPRHLNIKNFLLMYEQLWQHYAHSPQEPKLRRHLYELCLTTANVYANSGYTAEASGFLKKALRLAPSVVSGGRLSGLLGAGFRLARSLTRQPQRDGRASAAG